MDAREHIADAAVAPRWEFDRRELFEEVDHCSRISQDIADIAEVKFPRQL